MSEHTEQEVEFTDLRAANIARQSAWTSGEKVGLLFRATELGGETGEVLNVVKKIERERAGWRGSRATTADLADELADVVICADLLALTEDIDLQAAIVRKFNATSDKVGLPHRLALPATSADRDRDVLVRALESAIARLKEVAKNTYHDAEYEDLEQTFSSIQGTKP